jgi:hypothetical protein
VLARCVRRRGEDEDDDGDEDDGEAEPEIVDSGCRPTPTLPLPSKLRPPLMYPVSHLHCCSQRLPRRASRPDYSKPTRGTRAAFTFTAHAGDEDEAEAQDGAPKENGGDAAGEGAAPDGNGDSEDREGEGDEEADEGEGAGGEDEDAEEEEEPEPPAKEVKRKPEPYEVPKSGHFFMHDDRTEVKEKGEGEEEQPRRTPKKLWSDEPRWKHDKYLEVCVGGFVCVSCLYACLQVCKPIISMSPARAPIVSMSPARACVARRIWYCLELLLHIVFLLLLYIYLLRCIVYCLELWSNLVFGCVSVRVYYGHMRGRTPNPYGCACNGKSYAFGALLCKRVCTIMRTRHHASPGRQRI